MRLHRRAQWTESNTCLTEYWHGLLLSQLPLCLCIQVSELILPHLSRDRLLNPDERKSERLDNSETWTSSDPLTKLEHLLWKPTPSGKGKRHLLPRNTEKLQQFCLLQGKRRRRSLSRGHQGMAGVAEGALRAAPRAETAAPLLTKHRIETSARGPIRLRPQNAANIFSKEIKGKRAGRKDRCVFSI
jgi:hypothetical protein